MSEDSETSQDLDLSPYLAELVEIFSGIDTAYAAGQKACGGFSCTGCPDNCCTTVFHHYTLLENFYLMEGLANIDVTQANVVYMRAQMYYGEQLKNPFKLTQLRIMCPLNFNDKCIVYEHRPFICRIHGLPTVMLSPLKGTQRWGGCKRFQELHPEGKVGSGGEPTEYILDRTPFMARLASLEGRLRKELVYLHKYKKTIAEMVLDFFTDAGLTGDAGVIMGNGASGENAKHISDTGACNGKCPGKSGA